MTAFQVAELLQLNVETVYALITREGLPATRVGRRWRFDESRVRRWFHERCNETEITGGACHAARGRDHGVVDGSGDRKRRPASAGALEL
jgi:excisionase family DNA binding protein